MNYSLTDGLFSTVLSLVGLLSPAECQRAHLFAANLFDFARHFHFWNILKKFAF